MSRPASFRRDLEGSAPGREPGSGDLSPGDPDQPGRGGSGPRGSGRRRAGPGRFRRLRARRWFQAVMALLVASVLWLGWSVGHALTMPGGGTVSERLAEWARDHYLGPVVTFGEWVTYQPPKVGGKPSFALTGPSAAPSASRARAREGPCEGHAVLPAPGPADVAGGPPAARRRRVAGARHGQGTARHLRHLPAGEQRLYVLRGRHRVDEPEPGALRAPPGAEDPGPGSWKPAPTFRRARVSACWRPSTAASRSPRPAAAST